MTQVSCCHPSRHRSPFKRHVCSNKISLHTTSEIMAGKNEHTFFLFLTYKHTHILSPSLDILQQTLPSRNLKWILLLKTNSYLSFEKVYAYSANLIKLALLTSSQECIVHNILISLLFLCFYNHFGALAAVVILVPGNAC